MTSDPDVIVIGGGHNGLICAAYLARAGMQTLLLEARGDVGGCASTVHALGARVNICNCDHLLVGSLPIVDDLALADFGLRYLHPTPSYKAVRWDGSPPWYLFHDTDATLDHLGRVYPSEVAGYQRYLRVATPAARLSIEMAAGPPTWRRAVPRALRESRAAATLVSWSRRSAEAVLRDFFEDEAMITPALTTGPAIWGVSPKQPGTGLAGLSYAVRHLFEVGRPMGGSGALTDATRRSLEAAGGRVWCDSAVERVVIEDNRVRGVEVGGTVVEAGTVIAAIDPGVVLTTLLASDGADASQLRSRWARRDVADGYQSKIDAVVTEIPRFESLAGLEADAGRSGVDPDESTTIISPSIDEMVAAVAAKDDGRIVDRPMMLANVPSVLDPSMMVGGRHVFSLEVMFTPYALRSGWTGSDEPERWLDRFATLVQPGFKDAIEAWRVMTPVDYEEQFHLRRGYPPAYAASPVGSVFGKERMLSRYRTPIAGLYLTGAGTYPGAGIWGASGRNTAQFVLRAAGAVA